MTEKEKKAKFLEHYFVICREHGYYIDWRYISECRDATLTVEELKYYNKAFKDVKKELQDDIDG